MEIRRSEKAGIQIKSIIGQDLPLEAENNVAGVAGLALLEAHNPQLGFEIINLGGGNNPISINEMIKLFEKYLGKKAKVKNLPFNKADMQITWADISKAKELLGWKPEISFEDGIKGCVESVGLG